MESITLDDSTKQSVVKDIGDFLQPSFAQMCQKNGIPWRRGYLLHGPPGTGKTSFVKAIAAYFQLDVYILSLQDSEMDDTELQNIFMTLPQKSIVLVEELDRISVARRKSKEVSFVQNGLEQNDVKFSLCGLLSSLDGFATAEGYILIVTSNRPELLDETLTRPGRIDRKIEFKLSTKASAMKMFVKIYEGKQANVHMLAKRFGDLIPDNKLSLARIQEFLLASNPEDAITRASVHNSNCEDG
ncbi:hypothetical protein COCC4DRAFT_200621 [Bipolaris maydis ATCC 48331]|uniref:AAA+ ATPase domain-containing protein n=2 Tax=Cochliobolus heterostrophus TaxID=5016 RepID=M2UFV5_COCH5|nr:uncharacterized protein COCC4DRAFT_200621 [Bipolaris maydis ATCC 48331]EMD86807.1 hypothetical protein COCHEDRAFT_1198087 [Bipolaris maydis C5]ENI03194.1 hypothetical protein COCC4DRAFT_200621 [Bipolaris maydis ATCC 48331]KAJ6267291.1 P-loop containing nucleoside triphosphate hydrolase protein [Bipolaris maydis]KAJ6267749.1 P-loop containing nucleoside triphosphate hydrolase protein [Bipolaris maydis]